MSEIASVFTELRSKGEAALIGFITAGDPRPEATPQIAQALLDGGVDILELGIPFSDPIADGPTIQASVQRALTAGTNPHLVFDLIHEIKESRAAHPPLVILTYYNLIYHMGPPEFLRTARRSGATGLVVPDLPIDEAGDYRQAALTAGIDTIFLATPATPDARLRIIAEQSSGFLYLVSTFGVTGARSAVQNLTLETLRRAKKHAPLPVAVGFGVSRPEHVRTLVQAGADGVIVGSHFCDLIRIHLGDLEGMCAALREAARDLKRATHPIDQT